MVRLFVRKKHILNIVLFLLVCAAAVYAEDATEDTTEVSKWYEPFFIEAAGQFYFAPGLFSEMIKPGFGFRLALGYEYNRFRFALESGYASFAGTDPHILEFNYIPLVFKAGYALPLFSIVGLQADLSAGVALINTSRYATEIDLAKDNILEDSGNSFMCGGRLYATVTPWSFLGFYAGGGTDILFENDGPIFLPLVEIGLHFKPFALPKSAPRQREEITPVIEERREEVIEQRRQEIAEEITTVIEERQITDVTVETTNEGVMLRLSNIQFGAESSELPQSERRKLQEIANILRDIPGIQIRVEGHTALSGTAANRNRISRQRAQAVASYLISLGAIDADNVTVIGYGANRPIADNATTAGRAANRRVEIIISNR